MNTKEYLEEIKKFFIKFTTEVKVNTACGHFDINKIAENVYLPILRYIFNCPELKNLNLIKYNYPAVDLGCFKSRISFQITSTPESEKIIHTLEQYKKHNLKTNFDRINVLIITEKQRSYTSKRLEAIAKELQFNVNNDILDYQDLLDIISSKDDIDFLKELAIILKKECELYDKFSRCREHIDSFSELSLSQIQKEINSKKYIPDIFIESNIAKDKARFFSHPFFFHRKIIELIKKINLQILNEYLEQIDIVPISITNYYKNEISQSDSFINLLEFLNEIKNNLSALKSKLLEIKDFGYGSQNGNKLILKRNKKKIGDLLKLKLANEAFRKINIIDEIFELINLCLSRVFLITSMAGQGKTNFVCDFTKTFCQLFEIPTIFIPARELNTIHEHDIFKFIINNRYFNNIKDKFELFELFESIFKEINKPFLIIIDGINEITNLSKFNAILNDFIDTSLHYNSIKFIITCRLEFFEEKFSDLIQNTHSDKIYHINDLKNEMNDFQLDLMLDGYFSFFKVKVNLSEKATDFLKNDRLLLRIFCEINESKSLGIINDIYKGDLFEKYLQKVISQFPKNIQKDVIPVIFKLIKLMLLNNNFITIPTASFNKDELEIIDRLVYDEIILRREVPANNLLGIGNEEVNFTYDELRDFLISYYLIKELAKKNIKEFFIVYNKIKNDFKKYFYEPSFVSVRKKSNDQNRRPVSYEGIAKYTYILARKDELSDVCKFFSQQDDFSQVYPFALLSLPSEYHTEDDLANVKQILVNFNSSSYIDIALYLYLNVDTNRLLNIRVLLDHINELEEKNFSKFICPICQFPRH